MSANKLIALVVVCALLTACAGVEAVTVPPTATAARVTATSTLEVAEETPTPTEVVSPTASLDVPPGTSVSIDGVLTLDEWEDAAVEVFADGSELLLMQDNEYLYLGIRSNTDEMIAGNVLFQQDQQITIHHTSAALGTAIYQFDGVSWNLIQPFEWCCRSTSDTESAQSEREAFFQESGWVSVNSRLGTPNELEYQIRKPYSDFRMAVNFLRVSSTGEKVPWPIDLTDDSVKPISGGLPETMLFSPEQWTLVSLSE